MSVYLDQIANSTKTLLRETSAGARAALAARTLRPCDRALRPAQKSLCV